MAITKLTEEHLPTFIYITDLILSEEEEIDYEKIAMEGIGSRKNIDSRTIKRAFDLREELTKKVLKKKVYKPSIKTLNTLTAYYFDDTDEKFLKIAKTHKSEISGHFKKHAPKAEVVQDIFNPKPEKIRFLEEKQQVHMSLRSELNEKKLEVILANMEERIVSRFAAIQEKMVDEIALKTKLITHLEVEIERLQRKLKQAHSIHKALGAVGLFFLAINYDTRGTEDILEGFLDEYEGLTDDAILDDLL